MEFSYAQLEKAGECKFGYNKYHDHKPMKVIILIVDISIQVIMTKR